MDETLADPEALERFEYASWTGLVGVAPPGLAADLGLKTRDIAGTTAVIAPNLPSGEFNRGALVPGVDLADILAFLRQGAPQAIVQIAEPLMTPALEASLRADGCTPAPNHWIMLARGPGTPPPPRTALSLREIGPESAEEAGSVFARGYGMPPAMGAWMAQLVGQPGWRVFAAFDGDRIVGVGNLCQDGARAIMLGAATLPEARGRGAQTALLALRIAEATRAGAQLIQAHTGLPLGAEKNPSLDNMHRAGFEDRYRRLNWRVRPSAS